MTREYLSVDEMAKELSISRATAWKWMRRHELPTFRFMGDRKTCVRRADLARFRQPIEVTPQKKQAA